jgi:hypothetical protein
MAMNLNNADRQQSFELIPAGTICSLIMKVRPGGTGEGGWLKQSKTSENLMLDCEFTVTEGEFIRRKLWQNFVVDVDEAKPTTTAGNISRQFLRAIVESARNIDPVDMNQEAMQKRVVDIQDFNGMEFIAEIGIQVDKSGKYGDSNKIKTVITSDMEGYIKPNQQPVQSINSNSIQNPQPQPAKQPQKPTIPVPSWAK